MKPLETLVHPSPGTSVTSDTEHVGWGMGTPFAVGQTPVSAPLGRGFRVTTPRAFQPKVLPVSSATGSAVAE